MAKEITTAEYQALAELRYRIRKFIREGDAVARSAGLEPQQYLLLLALRGLPGGVEASIRTLADRLAVRLGVVHAGGGKTTWLTLPIQRSEPDPTGKRPREAKDFYIPRFGWLKNGVVWAQVLDRLQDQLDLYFIDVSSGHSQLMLSEKSSNWVPVNDDFNVLDIGDLT